MRKLVFAAFGTLLVLLLATYAPPPRPSLPNPLQVAILHWYSANQTTSFSVGTSPYGVAFDGANIWVANQNSGSVSKL
jgi:hypothetical protein